MLKQYNPFAWYWLMPDGTIVGSAAGGVVDPSDPAFLAWSADGAEPTHCPRGEDGAQTLAALQAELTPYGVFVDLAAYAAAKRYAVETGGITVGDAEIATDRASQALISGAFNLVTVAPKTSIKFKASGTFVTLDAAAVTVIATEVGQHVQACFSKEADVVAGIAANLIKTKEDVDAAFATLAA